MVADTDMHQYLAARLATLEKASSDKFASGVQENASYMQQTHSDSSSCNGQDREVEGEALDLERKMWGPYLPELFGRGGLPSKSEVPCSIPGPVGVWGTCIVPSTGGGGSAGHQSSDHQEDYPRSPYKDIVLPLGVTSLCQRKDIPS